MKIEKRTPPDLQEFIENCESHLLTGEPTQFQYPSELLGKSIADAIWEEKVSEIKELNKSLLSGLRNKANVYAIFTKAGSGGWVVRYVGERKAVDMRQRITNHLITKSDGTGAKLDFVREAVSKGESIGLRFLFVGRDTLRTCIEEEIISRNKSKLIWNKHG